MLFSVLVPAYNSASYLSETLESLKHQTISDFEVIVVDDRSSDETAELAAHLIRKYGLTGEVITRSRDNHGGASGCRNIALDRANGEWIAFLDSDDKFAPNKLERMREVISRSGKDIEAIYHKSIQFDDSTGAILCELSGGGDATEPRWILERLLTGNFHATCGMVIKKSLLRQLGGFDLALNGVEDWWLVLRVSKRTPWVFIDEPLASVRARAGSLMRNQPFAHYVLQHLALLRVAAESHELTVAQMETLERYLMGPLTFYFAGLAYSRGGWPELFVGLRMLLSSGHPRAACRVIYREMRTAARCRVVGVLKA